ncbi:hypothetical protein SCACP_28430 [Sporomusa carbonis]|uniref:hypothetical protein n=1 Tax=Sporomusa carbonis TaxID=3076075 RepID=UPI003A606595
MCANITIDIRRHSLAKSVVGFLSGFLEDTTSFNGPPLVLYMMNQGEDKITMRADLVRYFFLGNIATLIIAYFMGSMPIVNFSMYIVASIPAIALGW